jgi:hypothetical protein
MNHFPRAIAAAPRRVPAAVAAVAAASLTLLACGSDADAGSEQASGAAVGGSSGASGSSGVGGSQSVGGSSGGGGSPGVGGAPGQTGGSGGAPAGAGGATGAGASGQGASGAGASSPGAPGWEKAFAAGGVGVSCASSLDEMIASGAPSLTSGNTRIFVGFQQSGNNQDPVFRRFDGGTEKYCEHHEKQGADGRAVGLTWDGGPTAYVVYTIVGGGTDLEKAAKGGWIGSYGDGGGSSAVSVIGEVEVEFGTLKRATFVPAKKTSGTKTNTLKPADAVSVLADGTLEFLGSSAYSPLNPDKTPMCLGTVDYPKSIDPADDKGPSFLGRFSPDLSKLLCGTTVGCSQIKQPCP